MFSELFQALSYLSGLRNRSEYQNTLFNINTSLFSDEERNNIEQWKMREFAMMNIMRMNSLELYEHLKNYDLHYHFVRASDGDPDETVCPERQHAYTPGVDDLLIAHENRMQLRYMSYEDFISENFVRY